MKKKTVLHGKYIIRVCKVDNISGQISIEDIKTKEKTIADIDSNGVFRQKDTKNPGAKVVQKAIKVYRGLM